MRTTRRPAAVFLTAVLSLAAATSVAAQVLYDGSLDTTPDAQDWYYLTEPVLGAMATQTAGGGMTTLDTTPERTDKAGYFSEVPPFLPQVLPYPALDRTTGFRVSWTVRLDDEIHVSQHRAGLSVIVLAEDLQGVEIAHWLDEIWIQSVDFEHAEGAAIDTTAQLTTYDVCIEGDAYTLSADGTTLLTGALRDYSWFGLPYDIPSFLFVGDDTSSASARIELSQIEVSIGPCSDCTDCSTCDDDGLCEDGEDCWTCPNDCISGDGAVCGNGVCEAGDGEDCLSCPDDCRGKQSGKPSGRYCCGDGDGEAPVSCADARCTQGEWQCTDTPATASCCGDYQCEGIEDSFNCSLDCGPAPFCGDGECNGAEDPCSCADDCGSPPATESLCADGFDDDCDGAVDCDDDDCAGDPACQCGSPGAPCASDADCCSLRCKGGRTSTCR